MQKKLPQHFIVLRKFFRSFSLAGGFIQIRAPGKLFCVDYFRPSTNLR